jgi:peptide/nickel transport system ATP-binding protein
MTALDLRYPNREAPDTLIVEDLDIAYRVRGSERQVLRSVSFRIGRGEAFGLVGESGCGKSTVALAIVRYLARNARLRGGRILVEDNNLLALDKAALRNLRATTVSMVYQDPNRALNPSLRIGRQVAEIFTLKGLSQREAFNQSTAMLKRVRIADPGSVMERYPHQLSGGMQQRVAIAMALAINPKLLILDEPTTGLDATVEAEVLDLIAGLRLELSTSVLFISHNLSVIAQMCDRVGVLYAGSLVEEGSTAAVFNDPRHPYTVGLLRCLPQGGRRKNQGRLDTIPGLLPEPGNSEVGCLFGERCTLADHRCRSRAPPLLDIGGRASRCYYHDRAPMLPRATPDDPLAASAVDRSAPPVLSVRDLTKTFGRGAHTVRAVSNVSLDLWPGETLGLVGESGSGKTTFAHLLLGLIEPDRGSVLQLSGQPVPRRLSARTAEQIKSLQIVFQNPDSALNRAHTVQHLIGRAISQLAGVPHRLRSERLLFFMKAVRLAERFLTAKPRQLSGGLKQRVAIARAFAGKPQIVVCDEPTSALDVSVQAAILNLLADLQSEQGVSYIFISHDLATVRYLSDRIAVLYLGKLMEIGPAEQVFAGPHHPYTEALLSAAPDLEGKADGRIRLHGEIPSAINPPSGCVFHTRCPRKIGRVCEDQEPALQAADPSHHIRCHLPTAELGRRLPLPNRWRSPQPQFDR